MSNKLYYSFVGLMFIAAIILFREILLLEKIPDTKTFDVHLNTLGKIAQKTRENCYQHHKRATEHIGSADPHVLHALAGLDKIISFGDSADLYFHRLGSFKNNPDSARRCFAKYIQFSNRFTVVIHEVTGKEVTGGENYLSVINERLPGKKLPFESEQGIELLALLLQIEFYERMQRALEDLASFSG